MTETVFVKAWKPAVGEVFFARIKHSSTMSLYWPDGKDTVSIPSRPVTGKLALGGPFRRIKVEVRKNRAPDRTRIPAEEVAYSEEAKCHIKRNFALADFSFRPLVERAEI